MDVEATENPPQSKESKVPSDKNDYSRFDGIGDDVMEDTQNAFENAFEGAIRHANVMKETGNASFKDNNTTAALNDYLAGLSSLAALSEEERKKAEVVALQASLHGNVSMCYIKLCEWSKANESACAVLEKDALNVKALYRRGLALHKLQSLDEAKRDLSRAVELDASNAAAKKELVEVEKSLKQYAAKEKAKFGSMFGGKSMYDDKEQQRLAKLRQEEEKEAKRKDDWTKDKISRRTRGDAELTYEEWKKEKEKEEKRAEDERKEKEKELRRKSKASSSTTSSSTSGSEGESSPRNNTKKTAAKTKSSDSDAEEEEDEEVKSLIKGYKTTSDGRKTSYFNNELDSTTKQLIGDIAPKPISVLPIGAATDAKATLASTASESRTTDVGSGALATDAASAASIASGSAWNYAGTFEEKDMTSWAKERLTAFMNETKVSIEGSETANTTILTGAVHCRITTVKKLEGDAQIIVSRGKARFLYDFVANLEWEVVFTAFPVGAGTGDEGDKVFKGRMDLTDISPDSEIERSISFKKAPPPEHRDRLNSATDSLYKAVQASIKLFEQDFQQRYTMGR
jgi:tetratricopeptide (TPR) repeat protein